MPGIDPKRPCGDLSFHFRDMATALGIVADDEALEARGDELHRLHQEMQPTLQVFLRHAQLPSR